MIKEIQNKPHFQMISDNQGLAQICELAQQKAVVALDTEFIRVRSYYPKLGLIQLYDGEQVSLIDPNDITDFSPFIALLSNKNVLKVLHACYEDLEVFQHYFNQLPTPLIDTQIMANFLSFPNSTGLATLMQHYFEFSLDKGASRTDWLARPLSDKQLEYAAADVWYLLPLYHKMAEQLAQTPWQSAVQFDSYLLLEKQEKVNDPDKAYLTIPNVNKLNSEELMRLKLLAKWRQQEAIKRDLALNFVVRAENLWLVAKYHPQNTSNLLDLGIHSQEVRIHGKKMLQVIEQIKRVDPIDYPAVIERFSDDPRYKKTFKALQQKLLEITPKNLACEVIASRKSLEKLMKWVWLKQKDPDKLPDLMRGWREPFGQKLCEILETP
ncbi:ribonuclease D [Lonepinella koalarum]|uniref:Ribonuclease D n=1 Tax=Lonepinella koalarum TaxID=53417 RepID=A0A4R1KSY8_9PAST|nr:ribonuclease D [Lonepinella koalarum]MDH2927106.1 ribonuclease D [Lonepinella koalarum]TCK68225.1 ribonuclease D [Lonepinella koalarum]TFJ89385.1 ribonuclease D [Lonepinella koalarum]TYG33389.1 ribonuclease D [Lonepinella koalarum]